MSLLSLRFHVGLTGTVGLARQQGILVATHTQAYLNNLSSLHFHQLLQVVFNVLGVGAPV